MHDLIIIGAGPGGIALAAEAFASGIDPSQILILEKGPTHNSAIRQLYPEQKLTTANYKGFAARCEGLLCVRDMTKLETLQFFNHPHLHDDQQPAAIDDVRERPGRQRRQYDR